MLSLVLLFPRSSPNRVSGNMLTRDMLVTFSSTGMIFVSPSILPASLTLMKLYMTG